MSTIVPFYAGLLVLLFMFLSVRVVRLRRSLKVTIGDSGNKELLRAMRVHSNFAEYVPLALLLLLALELQAFYPWVLHLLGAVLLLGRLLHAYGVSQLKETLVFRIAGMACTFLVMGFASLWLIYRFVMNVSL